MVVVLTLSTRPARRWDAASKMTAPWKRLTNNKETRRALQRDADAAAAREAAAHAQTVLERVTDVVYRPRALDPRVETPT